MPPTISPLTSSMHGGVAGTPAYLCAWLNITVSLFVFDLTCGGGGWARGGPKGGGNWVGVVTLRPHALGHVAGANCLRESAWPAPCTLLWRLISRPRFMVFAIVRAPKTVPASIKLLWAVVALQPPCGPCRHHWRTLHEAALSSSFFSKVLAPARHGISPFNYY